MLALLQAYFLQAFLAELCAFAQFAKVERYCDTMITATTIGAVLLGAIGIASLAGVTAGMRYYPVAIASILLIGLSLLILRVLGQVAIALMKGRWKRN